MKPPPGGFAARTLLLPSEAAPIWGRDAVGVMLRHRVGLTRRKNDRPGPVTAATVIPSVAVYAVNEECTVPHVYAHILPFLTTGALDRETQRRRAVREQSTPSGILTSRPSSLP